MKIEKQRSISLDILRLLFFFAVTVRHICEYSGLVGQVPAHSANFPAAIFLLSTQYFTTSGFFFISAYFLVGKKETVRNIINTEIFLIFYSLVIFIIAAVFGNFSAFELVRALIKSLFPFLTHHYWYFFVYILMLAAAPALNRFIASISREEHFRINLFLVGLVCVFLSLNPFYRSLNYIGDPARSILWILTLYFSAAYIRLYGVKNKRLCGPVLFAASYGLVFLLLMVEHNFLGITDKIPALSKVFELCALTERNSILAYLSLVSLFLCFRDMKLKGEGPAGRFFSSIVPAFVVIYLVQEHELVRQWLWETVDILRFADSPMLLPAALGVFACLFAAALLLYAVYRLAWRLWLSRLEDRLYRKLMSFEFLKR